MKAGLAVLLAASAPTARPVIAPVGALPASLAPATALSAPQLPAPSALLPSLSPVPTALPAALSPSFQEPARALPALRAVSLLPAPSVGDAFDGAFAERREKKAEAVQYAHAEIPVVDYQRAGYSKERSAEMLRESYIVGEGRTMTGVQLLSLVVTPESLRPDLTPDPDRVDFNRLGKTSAQIRETAAARDIPYHSYETWLGAAFREGLIYRLFNKNTGLTYYGVPPQVRADWGLEPAADVPAAKAPAAKAEATPFSEALRALAADAESLPKHEELFEFTAQLVDAAIAAGRFPAEGVSAKFRARADALGYEAPSLKDAVLTLAESAEGTPWEAKTAALAALLD